GCCSTRSNTRRFNGWRNRPKTGKPAPPTSPPPATNKNPCKAHRSILHLRGFEADTVLTGRRGHTVGGASRLDCRFAEAGPCRGAVERDERAGGQRSQRQQAAIGRESSAFHPATGKR